MQAKRPKVARLWSAPRAHPPRLAPFALVQRGPESTRQLAPLIDPDKAPDWWPGTNPEWWVYQWLLHRGLKERVDFTYQENVQGGRVIPGGSVIDFMIRGAPGGSLLWRIQGYYWHYGRPGGQRMKDYEKRLRLEGQGFTVIDILDRDIEDPQQREKVLDAALRGVELISLSPFIFGRP